MFIGHRCVVCLLIQRTVLDGKPYAIRSKPDGSETGHFFIVGLRQVQTHDAEALSAKRATLLQCRLKLHFSMDC
ncbi:MAG: hypothetical protein LBI29_02145 [Rickettsiales bacterium]|nr:hypothetical protein [Rickettsiales bacterium]